MYALAYVVYDDEPSQTRSWNYSNLAGNLPSEVPEATDDFYLNTNYEWLSEHQETAASDTLFISMTTQALTDLYSLVVTDPNDPNVSVYSAFLVSYMDTSGRDSAGTGDLMPYITGLMEADSLSDLTDYLISGDCVLTGPFVDVSVAGFDTISDENILVVSYDPLALSSPSLYLGDSFRYYMDPSTVINEVVADMGGMALALDIASDIEGFDYVEMFTEYADSWVGTLTQQYDDMYMKPDVHPPNCIRVNMTVQQFQQFFDTFGVAEGDGMWLAPDDRVDIW